MADNTPQSAYDTAVAVFSQAFRFVEWKYIIVPDPVPSLGTKKTAATSNPEGFSAPLGDRGEPALKAIKPIDRQKWIYVFRQDEGTLVTYASILEEIRVDADGKMYATPRARLEKPIAQRGKPVAIGTTMCLPRRLLGIPKWYRFYASRVRLPLAQIKQLENNVYRFAPRTILDPADNTSVVMQDGKMLVPVVDPITVALHLHAAFVAAADDLIDYTVAHPGLSSSARTTVDKRRKKQLLGSVLKAIIGEEKNVSANNLVHELKGQQGPLEEFLVHYDKQIDWRVGRRDRFARYLVRWLTSDAVRIAADAHKTFGKDLWARFLVPWCHVITRLFDSPVGRSYLTGLLDDKGHFVHTFVLPQKPLSADGVQAVRKGGMTIFEGWSALVEAQVAIKGTNHIPEVVESFRYLRGLAASKKLTASVSHSVESIDRTITSLALIDPGPVKEVQPFSKGAKSLGAIIEGVNLVFAVKALDEALQGEDPKVKQLAVINLVGSSLDATSAVASLMRKSEKAVAVLGFVSGVIDVYLGVTEMNKAFDDGDQDVANGAFVTAAGATVSAAGSLLVFAGFGPVGQAVAVVGLAIVAIGMIYKWLKGKDPLERFFQHCSWGEKHDEIVAGKLRGGADWSPTRFEQWTGDKEFDYQLEALLNIISKVEISWDATYRDLRFNAPWLPANSKLLITYQETWGQVPFPLESEILLKAKGPATNDARIAVAADGPNGVKVTVVSGVPTTSPNQTIKMGGKRLPQVNLKQAFATARVIVALDGASPVKVPHDKPVKKTFYG